MRDMGEFSVTDQSSRSTSNENIRRAVFRPSKASALQWLNILDQVLQWVWELIILGIKANC